MATIKTIFNKEITGELLSCDKNLTVVLKTDREIKIIRGNFIESILF